MRIKTLALLGVMACCLTVVGGFAQRGGTDLLSGMWTGDWGPSPTDRNQVTVQLKWDGNALSGTVNPDGPGAVQLEKATFDPKTNAVHMEAAAPGRGGRTYHYVIDGKVQNGAMTGSWNHDRMKGDFKITKK